MSYNHSDIQHLHKKSFSNMYHDHTLIQMQYITLTIETGFGIQLGYQFYVPNI
jgi:hypothetical protein